MKLQLANYMVKDVVFGDRTFFHDGILTINKEEAIKYVREDEHITDCNIEIAKPGESIRIVPVKEAVEPRAKTDGRPAFPGVTGDVVQVGDGRTNCLKGVSVLGVGMHWGSFGDGIIDMSGEGAKLTHFSGLTNICLICDTDELFEQREQQKKNHALRWATHRFAEYLALCIGKEPEDELITYELGSVRNRKAEVEALPAIIYVMQPQSQMEEMGYNSLLYGWDLNHFIPSLVHPNEILDGAVIDGSFMPCSSKWSTFDFQNNPVITRLYAEHGKTLNFLGVIMSNLNVSLEQKQRSAQTVAKLANIVGADGAILSEEGYGNPDTDFIACFVELEKAGVLTVGLTNECTGRDGKSQPLVVLDELANAIVSTGNVSELIELPAMDHVIGELAAAGRDGLSGGWDYDEILGPTVRKDGSIIIENNSTFCGDQIIGWSPKTMKEF